MSVGVGTADHHGPSVGLFGRTYPILLPKWGDPRLAVAAVITSVQVLGQTVLGFDLSIAQILISLGVAGLLDVVLIAWERGVIAWPASALLTGNGVALLLRVPGTEHGDWWSTRGWPIFAATAAVAVLSKYVTRVGGRPLLNPSNGALVVAFLVFGSNLADPQDLWWGPWSPGLAITYAVILAGGLTLMRRLRLQRVVVPFLLTYGAATAVVAVAGHSMTARWHVGPVSGLSWWWVVVGSPELLIFLFFMITDPPTAAKGRVGGAVYGVAVAVVAATLMATQGTEFGTKVALLGALTLVCLFRPMIEALAPEPYGDADRLRSIVARVGRRFSPNRPRTAAIAVSGISLVAVAALLAALGSSQYSADSAPNVERPDVAASVGDLPDVTLDPMVADLVPGFDQAQADELVADVAAGLVIEAEAIDAGTPDPLGSAVAGPRLEAAKVAIDPSLAAPPGVAPAPGAASRPGDLPGGEDPAVVTPAPGQRVTFTAAEVAIVRTSDSAQALPSLAVRGDGTIDGTADGARFSSVFVVTKPADDYLLVDVIDPETLPGG